MHIIVLCEGLYVQQVALPHVHSICYCVWIAQEPLCDRSVISVSILLLQLGPEVRLLFLR